MITAQPSELSILLGANQFSPDRRGADFPGGGGGARMRYQEADRTLLIFYHSCQL